MEGNRKFRPYHVAMNLGRHCVYKYTDERRMGASKVQSFPDYDEARFFANKMNAQFVRATINN